MDAAEFHLVAMEDPTSSYAAEVVRRRLAKLCAALGWQAAHPSALDVRKRTEYKHGTGQTGSDIRSGFICRL